jgi:capsular exopolysaccharide synthesis family protein
MHNNNSNLGEATLHAMDYWQVIKNRYGVILLTLLLVFMAVSVITYVMPKRYESFATIELKAPAPLVAPFGADKTEVSGRNAQTANFFGTEFEKIKSRNALMKAVDSLDLTARWGVDRETAYHILRGIVDTQNVRGTDLIKISVRHQKREDARDVAAGVARAYSSYRAETEGKTASTLLNELRKAVRQQEEQVENSRQELANIVRTKGIIYTGEDSYYRNTGVNDDLGAQTAQQIYNQLEQEIVQFDSQIQSLNRFTSEQLMRYAAGLDLPENVVKTLHPQYLALQLEFQRLKSSGLGDRHPDVITLKDNLEGLWAQMEDGIVSLRATLRAQLDIANDRLTRVEKMRDETREEAIQRGIDAHDYVEAKKRFETDQGMLQQMRLKLIGETITDSLPQDSIIIHDDPVISESPVSPNVKLNLVLGAAVGLLFGIGIAFFLEYLDTSVKSLEDVERYLQVPVLAVIPKDVGVLHKQNGMSPDAEAYRILRTNIEFNRKNPEDNAITVVSGGAGEGKSTTLVNLAYVCAQGGYTTLMIDADLRRPTVHTFFDISNAVGLTNYLTTELMLEDVILQTPVDNLYFMPSGILPSDAAGILNSRRMSELIADVKQRFDLILIDSPPILGVSDASVLASEVDLTMIVIQHRKLPRNMLLRVKHAVENVGGTVIGVVLNNVDVRSDSQYQYYTSYYTYYAPSEGQKYAPSTPAQDTVQYQQPSSKTKAADEDLY